MLLLGGLAAGDRLRGQEAPGRQRPGRQLAVVVQADAGTGTDPGRSPAGAADDEGGSSPAEAIADQAEAPHPVTTPDDPAEVVDVDKKK